MGRLPPEHLRGRDRRDRLWSGEPADEHLRSEDFFDVGTIPRSPSMAASPSAPPPRPSGRRRPDDPRATQTVTLETNYLGEWKTPWWEGDENKGGCTASASRPQRGSTATTSVSPGRTRSPTAGWLPEKRSISRWTWRGSARRPRAHRRDRLLQSHRRRSGLTAERGESASLVRRAPARAGRHAALLARGRSGSIRSAAITVASIS